MAAPIGNEYWRIREKDGRDLIFETPEDLANACNAYFEWAEANPLKEEVSYHSQGNITKTEVNKMRAFTAAGLCNHAGISLSAFKVYGNRKGFKAVYARAKQIMYAQKLEGSAAELLNPVLIARELNLADKQVLTADFQRPVLEGGKSLPSDSEGLSDDELLGLK